MRILVTETSSVVLNQDDVKYMKNFFKNYTSFLNFKHNMYAKFLITLISLTYTPLLYSIALRGCHFIYFCYIIFIVLSVYRFL